MKLKQSNSMMCLFFFLLINVLLSGKEVKIARDKTMMKDGPGNYFDNILILKIGTTVDYIDIAKKDKGWIEVTYSDLKGFISNLALQEVKSNDMFGELDENLDFEIGNQIAPASYTAAIKGFALDYAKKKGGQRLNVDDLLELTAFSQKDFFKVKRQAKLAYFPDKGELIGVKKAFINDRMQAVGLAISLGVLKQGVVFDKAMTKKINVIANILNRQTYDYDQRYYAWIIKDSEPVAYSGPGGYIFISDTMLKILSDYREIVAVIAHEIGHIALRHGVQDLAVEQARHSAELAFQELDQLSDNSSLELSKELESVVDQAVHACRLVRDDVEEFEADDVALKLLELYKIDQVFLKDTLSKVYLKIKKKYPEYKEQLIRRINRIK